MKQTFLLILLLILAIAALPDQSVKIEVTGEEIAAFSAGFAPSKKPLQTDCCRPPNMEDTVAHGARCVTGTQACAANICPEGTVECEDQP